jgi:hypothetical protein
MISMKPKPQSEEYRAFEALLGSVLQVSKAELKERLEQVQREKRKPKAHVSRASVCPSKPA